MTIISLESEPNGYPKKLEQSSRGSSLGYNNYGGIRFLYAPCIYLMMNERAMCYLKTNHYSYPPI